MEVTFKVRFWHPPVGCLAKHSAVFRKIGHGFPGLRRFMVSFSQQDYIFKFWKAVLGFLLLKSALP